MSVTIASLSGNPGLGENTGFIIVGFLFVIIVLSILAILTYLVGKLVQQVTKMQESKTAAAAAAVAAQTPAPSAPEQSADPAPASVPASDDDIPPHVLALIAAATHVVLDGRPQRIVGVRRIGNPNWAQEGRREIFSSHRFR